MASNSFTVNITASNVAKALEEIQRAYEAHNSETSSPLLSFMRRGKEDISMCEKCYPTSMMASWREREYQEYMERVMRGGGLSSTPKTATPQEQLVDQIKALHAQGEDISGIKDRIDRIENEARAEIVKDLRGVASLAKKTAKPVKQFLLTYWYGNKSGTVRGVDFAYGEYIKDEDVDKQERVFLEKPVTLVVNYEYATMKRLEEHLKDRKIPYTITYLDD